MVSTNGQRRRGGLLDRVTCPHCWNHFAPEKVLWISEHQDLLGDQRLGPRRGIHPDDPRKAQSG